MFIRCSVESVMWIVGSWQWCDVNRWGDWGEVHRRCVSFSIWKRCSLLTDGSNVWDSHKPDWSQVYLPELPQRLILSWYQWEFFGFVAVFSKGTTFWGVFYREKGLFIWNTEAGFSQACLTVCVQACCSVKSIFELLPVDEKCLLSHIADVIFSHYWWRLSLMRWAGKKRKGNGIGKWPETNQT